MPARDTGSSSAPISFLLGTFYSSDIGINGWKEGGTMATSMSGRERYRTNKQDLSWTEEQASQNVGDLERRLSGLLGGALLVSGLFRRSWGGAIIALMGAALLRRGVTGHCMVYQAL